MGSGEGDASWDEHWRELRRWAEESALTSAACHRDGPHLDAEGHVVPCPNAKEDDPAAPVEY